MKDEYRRKKSRRRKSSVFFILHPSSFILREVKEPAVERIPILRMGDFLLVTIQVDMHDRLALALQDDLTTRISETATSGVLIDISALEIVDSFIGRMIANISGMARALDAET